MMLLSRLVHNGFVCANPGRNIIKNSAVKLMIRQCAQTTEKKYILGGQLSGHLTSGQRKVLGGWLLGCAGMCFGAVTLGGLTRLTESGLSIVEWNVFKGMRPPLNQDEWIAEFEKYKQFPEYKYKVGTDKEMSLSEFKFIFYMEYGHRMWGRCIGLAFFFPAGYFAARGWFDRAMKRRMGLAGGLLLFQGFLGWYMVRSGLDPSKNSDPTHPRVSQYRLASHLTSAIVLYTMLLWSGLSHVFTPYDHNHIRGIGRIRGLAHASKTAMFITAVLGAFVAGLDAGLVYNSWPLMADRYVPTDLWAQQPWYRNLTENPTTVQFLHRNFAYTTLGLVSLTWLLARRVPLARRTRGVLHALMLTAYAQATLGVFTLIHYVPTWLAACHQSGSMVLISFGFWLTNELRRVPK